MCEEILLFCIVICPTLVYCYIVHFFNLFFISVSYTARTAQVAASLLQACCLVDDYQVDIRMRSYIACSASPALSFSRFKSSPLKRLLRRLMMSSLLQVVNRVDMSWLLRLYPQVSFKLFQV